MAFTKKIAGWIAGRIKGEQARKDTMRWMEKTGLGQVLDIAGDIALTQGAIKGVSGLKGLMTGQKAAQAGQTAATASTAKALPEGVTEVGRLASANPAESRALVGQMMAPTPAAGPVTPQIGMPKMPTSLPTPAARAAAAPTPAAFQPSAAGQAASRTVQSMAPAAAPAPVTPTFATRAMPLPTAVPGAASAVAPAAPMRAMTTGAPAFQPSAAGQAASRAVGGMTPPAPSPMQAMAAPGAPQPGMLRQTLGAVGKFGRENAAIIGATAPAVANVIGAKIEQDIAEEEAQRQQEARNRLAMLLMPMFQAQIGQAAPSFQPRG